MSKTYNKKIQQVKVLVVINTNALHDFILYMHLSTPKGEREDHQEIRQISWTNFWKIHLLYWLAYVELLFLGWRKN